MAKRRYPKVDEAYEDYQDALAELKTMLEDTSIIDERSDDALVFLEDLADTAKKTAEKLEKVLQEEEYALLEEAIPRPGIDI